MSTAIKPVPRFCYVDAMGGAPVQNDGSGPEIYVKSASSAALMADALIEFKDGTFFSGTPQSSKFSSDTAGVHATIIIDGFPNDARVDVTQAPDGSFSLGAVIGDVSKKPTMYPLDAGGVRFK